MKKNYARQFVLLASKIPKRLRGWRLKGQIEYKSSKLSASYILSRLWVFTREEPHVVSTCAWSLSFYGTIMVRHKNYYSMEKNRTQERIQLSPMSFLPSASQWISLRAYFPPKRITIFITLEIKLSYKHFQRAWLSGVVDEEWIEIRSHGIYKLITVDLNGCTIVWTNMS